MSAAARRPNLLVVLTDQQRAPMWWPGAQWLRELMPADAELRRTGLELTSAIAATCMCSPARATILTGLTPAEHGVTLTLTDGGARPRREHTPAVLRALPRQALRARVPAARLARGAWGNIAGPRASLGGERELPAGTRTVGHALAEAGYSVHWRGKWHLTKPADPARGWEPEDSEAVARHGFAGWVPPDAGEDIEPEHFGAGSAGPSGEGWDEEFTRQAEAFLADPPEPFALVVSLVNPHDVLAYPSSWRRGGFSPDDVRDLGVRLPPTADESLADKPVAHALQRLGQGRFLGALRDDHDRLAYVNFYARLHAMVDAKVGRVLAALGDPGDPRSLRSRTVVVRTSDHGEMGLSHGGLRQKMFNAYEETIRVPLLFSNPVLWPRPAASAAMASSLDIAPTLAALGGARLDGVAGHALTPVLARHAEPQRDATELTGVDLGGAIGERARDAVRDQAVFTYDDHKAGTAIAEVVPGPNRVRAIRTARWKYAIYLDPRRRLAPEHELYDLASDPEEACNLVDRATGAPSGAAARAALDSLRPALARDLAKRGLGADAGLVGGSSA